jgi:tRNA (guanine-N7-)-methyltransferase
MLEIGCGKGRFLAASAQACPEANFIGLERASKVFPIAARKLRTAGSAAALVFADVDELAELFGPAELGRIYINFCDPWPGKKKWAKRRLTYINYLNVYAGLLKADGEIHFKTDNRELFEFSIEQFSSGGWLLRNVSLDLHNPANAGKPYFDDNIKTEYEEKFTSLGMPIYRLEAGR